MIDKGTHNCPTELNVGEYSQLYMQVIIRTPTMRNKNTLQVAMKHNEYNIRKKKYTCK